MFRSCKGTKNKQQKESPDQPLQGLGLLALYYSEQITKSQRGGGGILGNRSFEIGGTQKNFFISFFVYPSECRRLLQKIAVGNLLQHLHQASTATPDTNLHNRESRI